MMWLREIVFQGVFGVERPAKVRVEKDFCSLSLPPGASAEAFRVIILSLLYPHAVSELALRTLGDHGGDLLRFGLVVEGPNATYKLFRQASPDSVTLQEVTDGQPSALAKGARDVGQAVAARLELPDLDEFLTLCCWDFGALDAVGAEGEDRLLELYCQALKADSLELLADAVRGDIETATRDLARLRRPLEGRAMLERELADLAAVTALTDDELRSVRARKNSDSSYEESLSELEEGLDVVRQGKADLGLVPIHREWIIVGSIAVAVVVFLISAVSGIRAIALANLMILGLAASTMLRRLGQAEQVSLLDIQAQQIQRRMAASSQDHQAVDVEVSRVLDSAGVRSVVELEEKLRRAAAIRLELDADIDAEQDASLRERVDEALRALEHLEADAARIGSERDSIGEVDLPSYEIENAATSKGIDLGAFKVRAGVRLAVREPLSSVEAQFVLQLLAERRGLFVGSLTKRTSEAWNKLIALLMGRGWDEFQLEPDGSLSPPRRTLVDPNWEANHPIEVAMVTRALAAAIIITTPPDAAPFRFVCIAEPFANLSPERAQAMGRVLKSMAGKANVLLLLAAESV